MRSTASLADNRLGDFAMRLPLQPFLGHVVRAMMAERHYKR
jgi:hypothetical protein